MGDEGIIPEDIWVKLKKFLRSSVKNNATPRIAFLYGTGTKTIGVVLDTHEDYRTDIAYIDGNHSPYGAIVIQIYWRDGSYKRKTAPWL